MVIIDSTSSEMFVSRQRERERERGRDGIPITHLD